MAMLSMGERALQTDRRFEMKVTIKPFAQLYLLVLLGLGLSLIFIRNERAWADADLEFTKASLKGDYASFGTGLGGMSPNASAGMLTFDGKGFVTVTEFLNQPGSSFPERQYDVSFIGGTYEVDPRGTGVILERGTDKILFSFIIIKAVLTGRTKIAGEISLIPLNLVSETGNLILYTATKLPNKGEFSLASLKGTYAFRGNGQGGQTPEAGIGRVIFDGKGNATSFDILNLPVNCLEERQILRFSFEAFYVVNESGFGSIIPQGVMGEALLVIRKAEVMNGIKVAQELSIIINDLSFCGNLVTDTLIRISSDSAVDKD
jgi:hypothetical protein